MSTLNKTVLPEHTPEVHAALEEVRDLLEGVDTSTPEGMVFALSLLRERGLPDVMIYIAQHQPQEIPAEVAAWAERILRADGIIP